MDERHLDHPGEREVHTFLVKYFYPIFQQSEEISDREQQIAGIDMKLCVNNQWFTVDEKSQLTRLNRKITIHTTQAIELLSKTRSGQFVSGWIFNSDTDYYLFTYITHCQTEHKKDLTCDKIQQVRAVLISKQQIIHMLTDNGITLKNLQFFADRMVYDDYNNRHKKNEDDNAYVDFKNLTDKIWLCRTNEKKLRETPVNCVIRWSLYEEYAWHVFDITPTGVTKIK